MSVRTARIPRRWVERRCDPRAVQRLAAELDILPTVARVLANRGITDPQVARKFMQPHPDHLHDPFRMTDMDAAVDRLDYAIRQREPILVYGDYDVDGVCSAAMLLRFIQRMRGEVGYYIPGRVEEGYGVNEDAVRQAAADGFRLMVTCDCGVTAVREAELASEQGVDVIVTDHHEINGDVPQARAVLDPKRPGCPYPFKDLAGVGVAFKLCLALAQRRRLNLRQLQRDLLDFVCLGTVADVVPLHDENRTIVRYGLQGLRLSSKPGIKALIDVAGYANRALDSYAVAFALGPRLNAAGRMQDARAAMQLLLSEDRAESYRLARELDRVNAERQAEEKRILDEAVEVVRREVDLERDRIIVLSSPEWHPGVIGIVASRIKDRYGRPTILLCEDAEQARGSCRSIPELHMFEALQAVRPLLTRCGGHAMAAGLTLPSSNIERFREAINDYAASRLTEEDVQPKIEVDQRLTPSEIDLGLVNELENLAPFGTGNPKPKFVWEAAKIVRMRRVGANGAHLKLALDGDERVLEAVGWHMGYMAEELAEGQKVDVCFALATDYFAGNVFPQLIVEDLRHRRTEVDEA